MSCYLYYKHDTCVLTDYEFDALCEDLVAQWEGLEHIHKHLTTKEDLEAGTGYAIKYTTMIEQAAESWLWQEKKEKL